MDRTASVMAVVDNKGPIRIGIEKEKILSTPYANLIKGSVFTFEGQEIIGLKIVLQKDSYESDRLTETEVDDLFREKLEELQSYGDQFLFLENQIDEDGTLIKFNPVFLCEKKNTFFSPLCQLCGSEFKISEDKDNRYLVCSGCSNNGDEIKYKKSDAFAIVYRMQTLFSQYVEQWTTIPPTEKSIKKFLKDSVNGIGDHLARTIVDRFGIDTVKILMENPNELHKFRGIGDLRLKNIKASLKSTLKKKVRIKNSIKDVLEKIPCFTCFCQKDCYKSENSLKEVINPIAFFPFSMIVYKDDMISGTEYLDSFEDVNHLNLLLYKAAFLKSIFKSLKNVDVAVSPQKFIEYIEVKRTKGAPDVFFPGVFSNTPLEADKRFFASLWFIVFLHNESNQSNLRSLLALIEEYTTDRESIVRSHMKELATPSPLDNSVKLWDYIITCGLDFLNMKNPELKDFILTIDKIHKKIDSRISEVKDFSFEENNKSDQKQDLHGMKNSFLKIEEVYVKSLEAIIKDIVKEFNPDNGRNGYGVSGFLRILKNRDEYREKFRKFQNWYESGSYIERFMGEVKRNFDSIKE